MQKKRSRRLVVGVVAILPSRIAVRAIGVSSSGSLALLLVLSIAILRGPSVLVILLILSSINFKRLEPSNVDRASIALGLPILIEFFMLSEL